MAESSIPRPTFEYVASLEWVRAKENLLLIGPPGTGKSHTLLGCGVRAVERGMKVRYLVAADLIETLYRSPLGIWGADQPAEVVADAARQDARLTHPHPVCAESSAMYAATIAHAISQGRVVSAPSQRS